MCLKDISPAGIVLWQNTHLMDNLTFALCNLSNYNQYVEWYQFSKWLCGEEHAPIQEQFWQIYSSNMIFAAVAMQMFTTSVSSE